MSRLQLRTGWETGKKLVAISQLSCKVTLHVQITSAMIAHVENEEHFQNCKAMQLSANGKTDC